MKLAIFDLDNTLIAGDSDYLWGTFLAEKGLVDKDFYLSENERFYNEYKAGKLDIYEFLKFSLKPLSENKMAMLESLRKKFMQQEIHKLMLPKAKALIESHRNRGHVLLIITATNQFVTKPIADSLGIENLLATDPEIIDGEFSGEVAGTPCFQSGKVKRLESWLDENDLQIGESWFYSDSNNDLPLLKQVNNPVAVDADPLLTSHAEANGWPVISLRD